MNRENIFRFFTIRPPRRIPRTNKLSLLTAELGDSDFINRVIGQIEADPGGTQAYDLMKSFQASHEYVRDFDQLSLNLRGFYDWYISVGDEFFNKQIFIAQAEKHFAQSLETLIRGTVFRNAWFSIVHTIYVDANLGRSTDIRLSASSLVHALKLLKLLVSVVHEPALLGQGEKNSSLFSRFSLLIPYVHQKMQPGSLPPELPEEEVSDQTDWQEKFSILNKAHKEVSTVLTKEKYRYRPVNHESGIDSNATSIGRDANNGVDESEAQRPRMSTRRGSRSQRALTTFILHSNAFDNFSASTRTVINELGYDREEVKPLELMRDLEKEIENVSARLAPLENPAQTIKIGGALLNKARLAAAVNSSGANVAVPRDVLNRCHITAGVGDLLIVQQTLKAYELSEFSHTENVLQGETRERAHRRLNVQEEITETEIETISQTERDLQSTTRNEMQSEAEKQIAKQLSINAGVQVSGSYGPSISFTSSAETSFNTAIQEVKRQASSFSREVVESSSEKVSERIREFHRTRVLQEIEENNRHSFSNDSDAHIRGIYRWLNKIYDAHVITYGQRMLLDLVAPEPAAYFLYALLEASKNEQVIPEPVPPTLNGFPLKPGHLGWHNYQDYVAFYDVTSAPSPPPLLTTVSHFDGHDGKDHGHFGRATKVSIPDGYAAFAVTVSVQYIAAQSKDAQHAIDVGGVNFPDYGTQFELLPASYIGEVSIGASFMDVMAFHLTVDIHCVITPAGLAKWQHDVYDSIINAYLKQKAEYEEAKAEREFMEQGQPLGRNPLANRRLERDELKKLAVMILRRTSFMNFDSFYDYPAPFMDLDQACKHGKEIRFFENAFDWTNMLYVFYPYFWGRVAKWTSALQFTDPDSDFAAFLKAGAARVQIPVRPGFEEAVAHYLQYGQIWNGEDIPLRDDELYVPIIDEIKEGLAGGDEPVPYPEDSEPWEVTIPTSLVLVQDLEEIPGIRDMLTDEEMNL